MADESIVQDIYSAAWADNVVLVVRFSQLGLNRKCEVDSAAREAGAKSSRVKGHKVLLDSPEYDRIQRHFADVRLWLSRRTNPAGFLGPSVHLVRKSEVESVAQYLTDSRRVLTALLEQFAAFYDVRIGEAARDLGTMFDRSQYPKWEDVAARYAIRSRFVAVGPSDSLAGISSSLSAAELEGFVNDWRATVDDARAALRTEFAGLVEYFAGRLRDKGDGARQRFGENYGKLETLREFCTLFSARDLSGDSDLRAMAERVKGLISGVSAKDLKQSDGLRASLGASFDSIKSEAGALIVSTRRVFEFDADDSAEVAS
jgi:hypothetical protein